MFRFIVPFSVALAILTGCGGTSISEDNNWHPNNRPDHWSVVTTPGGQFHCHAYSAGREDMVILESSCVDLFEEN